MSNIGFKDAVIRVLGRFSDFIILMMVSVD